MDQASLPQRVNAQKLIMEHEMGELFKVIALAKGEPWVPLGFAQGDRTHAL
jgi:SAM-dependent MidA family methyltransferase